MKLLQNSFLFIGILSFCIFSGTKINAQNLIQSVENRYTQYKNAAPKDRVQIITDRDIYAPGELLWFHASVYDILSPKISTLSDVLKIQLFNNQSNEVVDKVFSLKDGSISGFIELPDNLEEGIYDLQGGTKNDGGTTNYFKKIIIKNEVVPPFVINLKYDKKEFQPGKILPLALNFEGIYKEPKKNVTYSLSVFDGDIRIFEAEGKIKKEALVSLNIEIPKVIKSKAITYEVNAECKGLESSLKGILQVISDDVIIEFYPESGSLMHGIPGNIHVIAYDEFGRPIAVEAELYEDGKVVSMLHTNDSGLGAFALTPQLDHSYYAVLTKPTQIEKHYELPSIKSSGISFTVQHKTASDVEYQVSSTTDATQKIVLFAESDGEIFWSSEQIISGSATITVDLRNATGRLVHVIALSTSAKIVGEHIVTIPKQPEVIDNSFKTLKFSTRSKVSYEVLQPFQEGKAVFIAVNSPWLNKDLKNQNVQIVALPYDISQQFAFKFFQSSVLTDSLLELIANYYVPHNFGWDRVLNTDGVYTYPLQYKEVVKNQSFLESFSGKYKISEEEGALIHSNLVTDDKFAMSNPDYISQLYTKKIERKPGYKVLLENGTPVLDVIQSLKSYKLEGNNIIFFGTDNSLNFVGGALIVIDGINRGTDASIISGINPQEVEKIFVSTDPNDMLRYSGLNSGGLIEIELKKGIDVSKTNKIADEDTQFTSPDYENAKDGKKEDFRSTLHWEVREMKNSSPVQDMIYYNSDLIDKVRCIFYFIPKDGTPTSQYLEYEIK